MTGNILYGVNDMKADIVGPVAKKSSKRKTAPKTAPKPVSKRTELIRTVMREQGMTLPQASSFIKNNK
jgi:phosphoribosylanthranilate isomerase